MRRCVGVGAVCTLLTGALACAEKAPVMDIPVMEITVTPSGINPRDTTGEVAIDMDIPNLGAAAHDTLFSISTSLPGLSRPQVISGLMAEDEAGPLPLTESGENLKSWSASREVAGVVRVRYRMGLQNAPMLQGGPPNAPRIDGSAFSSVGDMLFMKPHVEGPVRINVDWDLSAMGPGAEAISSFGDGSIRLPAGPADRLARAFFMVGPVSREPEQGEIDGFSAVWADDPGFDPRPVMRWTAELHTWMSDFFGDETTPPYRVFLRYNPMNAGGGAALHHSFVVTYGQGVTGESLKSILGHEMVHTWTANDLGMWYNEGNAVYYQTLLAWRAGLLSIDEYLADINATASRYYSNLLRDTPEREAVRRFWEDTRVRVLPYDRGAMYFIALDGKIRRASNGRRSVDDVVRALVGRAKADEPITEEVWLNLLRAEIGEEGPTLHRAMLEGQLIVPESGDLGPCFRRVTRQVRRFDVGFDFGSLIGERKVVRGLKPGSEAAKAGLLDGDEIRYGVSIDAVQGDVDRTFTVTVTRGANTFTITYLPRGEAVDVYQWERVPSIPESQCRP